MDPKLHWVTVYATKDHKQVSWFAEHVSTSLELIRELKIDGDSPIIDVGGGACTLVDDLVRSGHTNITVLDISGKALAIAKARLGSKAAGVKWIEADLLKHDFGGQRFMLWHDRAVFHFLTDESDRAKYREIAANHIAPGGHLMLSVFADDGPMKCSGLEVRRHAASEIEEFFKSQFRPVAARRSVHLTPGGAEQRFVHVALQRSG